MFIRNPLRSILPLLLVIILAACTPVAPQEPGSGPGAVPEPATPTPEIFNPLDPSPTPGTSDLPLTCQVTDLNVFIDRAAGYCFAYPLNFRLGDPDAADPTVFGPDLDDSADPLRASLEIDLLPVPAGSDLTALVDGFLASLGELPWPDPGEGASDPSGSRGEPTCPLGQAGTPRSEGENPERAG